jgi:hypothetical protein
MGFATGFINAGRAWHEAIMEDECTVTREGARTLNESTGQYSQTPTTVYTGVFRMVVPPRSPQDVVALGQVEAVTKPRADFPVTTSTGVRDGDILTVTASVDPALVGQKFCLRGFAGQTHATARRFFVEVYS